MNKTKIFTSLMMTVVLTVLLAAGLAGVISPNLVEPVHAANFTVTRFDDPIPGLCLPADCSLREAVLAANAAAGADTITLLAGTYTLSIAGASENASATGDLDIFDDLTITGVEVGVTIIDGGGLDRVFQIFGANSVRISNLTIQNGDAGSQSGGGILVRDIALTVTNVTVRNNTTTGAGGGILSSSALTIIDSTISDNTAVSGGGIVASTGTVDISNSTISGNTAVSGGGILNESANTTLTNVTVSHNNAATGGGIRSAGAGMVALTNSIVAAQAAGDDCSGPQISSNGHNLDSDGTCLVLPMPGDLPNSNPLLGPLQNHGGPTETHALLSGSVAIDAGDNATCAAAPVQNLDQRGQSRPADGDDNGTAVCDMGAYELHLFGNGISPLGTNMGAVFDWTPQLPFVDAFKMARTWAPTCAVDVADCDAALNAILDEDGWPTVVSAAADVTAVATILLNGDAGGDNNLAGEYTVLYDGEGVIAYGAGVTVLSSSTGVDVIEVGNIDFVQLTITQSNNMRNIRFMKSEYANENVYETQLFNPAFLDKVKPFRVLRFMDWMRTNGIRINNTLTLTPTGEWAERSQGDDYTYTTQNGVPLELMLALSNQTQIAPWFNMPHTANDEYMTEFATMVRDNLDSNLLVYVEYSNETWNGMFPQTAWVRQEGMREFDTDQAWRAGLNFHGMRAAQMCEIWETVWAGNSDRVVCIAAAQASNTDTAVEVLTCPLWSGGPCVENYGIDALAIAPYFGGYLTDYSGVVAGWDLDQLFDELTNGGLLPNGDSALERSYGWMSATAAVAISHGVELIAYEGGQHLDADNLETAADALFNEANRDPRMGQIYSEYFTEWRNRGGCLFANYTLVQNSYNQAGSWGILEYINQVGSPKYEAVMGFIEANPWPWTANCAIGQEMFFYQYLPAILQE